MIDNYLCIHEEYSVERGVYLDIDLTKITGDVAYLFILFNILHIELLSL